MGEIAQLGEREDTKVSGSIPGFGIVKHTPLINLIILNITLMLIGL